MGRRRGVPPGRIAALFVLLYAGLRIPIDLLREYPVNALGLPTGQGNNVIMAALGALFVALNWWRARRLGWTPEKTDTGFRFSAPAGAKTETRYRFFAFAAILLFVLVIPSDATRDIPSRYGHRHPGLEYSAIYPRIRR